MRLLNRRSSGNRRRKKTSRFQRKSTEQQRSQPRRTERSSESRAGQPLNRTIITAIGSFVAAFRFLSIIPLSGSLGTSEAELARSVPFFPLVG
ncbi:MAG: hypothetical protein D3910_27325, partial [Candidatus Electrothrix sp. ATG2]|nr:hypothetical protein [Candidatus Electrothrix sp. ATG2]